MAAPAERPRLRVPDREAGPAHVATLKTFDPPLATLSTDGARGRRAAREAAPLPHGGRRARAARPPDDGRAAPLPPRRRERAEGAGVPARLRGRRATRPDGGRLEEARRRVAADARAGRGRARAPRRKRSGSAPTGWPRSAPPSRDGFALAAARPEADRRHRPRVGERDPPRGEALAVRARSRSLREEVERLATAIDTELARGLALREQGAKDDKTYRVHKKLGAPCDVCATPIAQVDFEEHTIYYCPQCQTGGRVLKDRRLSRLPSLARSSSQASTSARTCRRCASEKSGICSTSRRASAGSSF